MRRGVVAALAAVFWLAGCGGGGGSLPSGNPPETGGGPIDIGGTPVEPGNPNPNPNPGNGNPDPGKPQESTSLWPLTPGSRWTYVITEDPNFSGEYTKVVEVKGTSEVPETNPKMSAMLVHSRQERMRGTQQEIYEERSWQVQLTNGLVVRVREEDFLDSSVNPNPIRITRWATRAGVPTAIMKGIAGEPQAGWPYRDVIREIVTLGGDPNNPETKDRTYEWSAAWEEQPLTVPAGTFPRALRLTRTKIDKDGIPTKERTYWLVPGVGKVKETGERTESLQSYDIKK